VSAPKRIQLRRTKGWRKPEGAIVVARPSRWGNNYVIKTADEWRRGNYGLSKTEYIVNSVDRHGHAHSVPGWYGGTFAEARVLAVDLHRRMLLALAIDVDGPNTLEHYLAPLVGRDLCCWCPLDAPCHADVLLELANR